MQRRGNNYDTTSNYKWTPRPHIPAATAEEHTAIDKMAEAYVRSPQVVDMVRREQRDNPKYHFLFPSSPLYNMFQAAIQEKQRRSNGPGTARPPPPVPPPHMLSPRPPRPPMHLRPPILMRPPPPRPPAHLLPPMPPPPRPPPVVQPRYSELPAGLMLEPEVGLGGYLELDTRIIENISQRDRQVEAMEDIFEVFDRGVRFIYGEGEFADSEQAVDASRVEMDNDGWWINDAQEEALHDRRSAHSISSASDSSSQEFSSSDQSSDDSSDSSDDGKLSSTSTSSACSASSASSASSSLSSSSYSSSSSSSLSSDEDKSVLPTNINRALGSDNIGFKMLSKLGWREGEGLGAESEGIREPIRLNTRFSNPRGGKRKKGQLRASLGSGRAKKRKAVSEDDLDPAYADYRKRKSQDYHKRSKRADDS